MAESNVSVLLDPKGEKLQTAAQGAPNAGKVAVTVHWAEIEKALDLGFTISAIHRVLSTEKVISVSLRTFTRQVQTRREGKKVSRAAARPAAETQALPEPGPPQARAPETHQAGTGVAEATVKATAGPRPSWLTQPPPSTNRNAVYKPPSPKSET